MHHELVDVTLARLGIFAIMNQSGRRRSTGVENDSEAGRRRLATVILSACITRAARTMTPKETTKESQHAGILAITRTRSLSTKFYASKLANAIITLA